MGAPSKVEPVPTKAVPAPAPAPRPGGQRRTRFAWIAPLVLFTLVQGLLYLMVVPPWQGPDEPGHFEYVALIVALGRVPQALPNTETLPELTLAINESAEANRFEQFHPRISLRRHNEQNPPLLVGPREAGYQKATYYLLLAPFYRLAYHQGILAAYYTLAFTSILLAVVTVLASALAVRTLLPDQRWAQLAVPLLAATWPTQAYLSTRVTNDNLATAVGAALFWLTADLLRRGGRLPTVLGTLGLLVVAAFAKGTTLFLIPVGALALALSLSRWLPSRVRQRLGWALVVIAGGIAVAGLLALLIPPVAAAFSALAAAWPGSSRSETWLVDALDTLAAGKHWAPARLARNQSELIHILRTFWAVFGWGSDFLPRAWYWLATGGAVISLFGWLKLLGSRRGRQGLAKWQWQAVTTYALGIGLAWVPLIARMVSEPFATFFHGRILLPALVPVCVLLVVGWQQWVSLHWQGRALQWLAAGLFLVQFAVFALVLLPHFYR